jgi:hypothetical protein
MAPNLGFVFAFAFLAEFFLFLNTGPLNAALVGSVPAGLRATAVALNVLCTHAFGDAVSPPIMGAISDLVERSSGDEMLGLRVAVGITAIPLALGGLVLLVGSRRVAALPNGLRTVDGARPPPSRKSGESKEQ